MRIRYEKLNDTVKSPTIESGVLNLFANTIVEETGSQITYSTGVKIRFEDGIGVLIPIKDTQAKQLQLANQFTKIDDSTEIILTFNKSTNTSESFCIGDCIAQVLVVEQKELQLEETIFLSDKDFGLFLNAIDLPQEPNAALKDAAKNFDKIY